MLVRDPKVKLLPSVINAENRFVLPPPDAYVLSYLTSYVLPATIAMVWLSELFSVWEAREATPLPIVQPWLVVHSDPVVLAACVIPVNVPLVTNSSPWNTVVAWFLSFIAFIDKVKSTLKACPPSKSNPSWPSALVKVLVKDVFISLLEISLLPPTKKSSTPSSNTKVGVYSILYVCPVTSPVKVTLGLASPVDPSPTALYELRLLEEATLAPSLENIIFPSAMLANSTPNPVFAPSKM